MTVRAIVAIMLVSAIAHAEPRATPNQILANVEATYKAAPQLTARFVQTVTYSTFGKTKTSSGKVYVAIPNKMRWDYLKAKGAARTFIFDGKTLWIVEHDNLQVMKHTAQTSNLPAAIAFFWGAGHLANDFDVALVGTSSVVGSHELRLVPKQPSAQYKELRLVIDPASWRVAKTILIDSSGNTNTIELADTDLKSSIAPELFRFSPTDVPDYKLVDVSKATVPLSTTP